MPRKKTMERHKPKPMVDRFLMYKALVEHGDSVAQLGVYEHVSRNGGISVRGLYAVKGLVKDLLQVEPSGAIHVASLKAGVQAVLLEKPFLNKTLYPGSAWVQMRAERLTTVLKHVRRLGKDKKKVLMELAGEEVGIFNAIMDLYVPDDGLPNPGSSAAAETPVEKPRREEEQGQSDARLKKRPSTQMQQDAYSDSDSDVEVVEDSNSDLLPLDFGCQTPRVLKKNMSDVSVDSDGYPAFLKTPPGAETGGVDRRLISALGFEGGDAVEKPANDFRPAVKVKAAKAKPEAKGKAKAKPRQDEGLRKPWFKLKVSNGNKPCKRRYICGTTEEGGKLHLIVEVSEKMHANYYAIADEIHQHLVAEHLTKAEALEMRANLIRN